MYKKSLLVTFTDDELDKIFESEKKLKDKLSEINTQLHISQFEYKKLFKQFFNKKDSFEKLVLDDYLGTSVADSFSGGRLQLMSQRH